MYGFRYQIKRLRNMGKEWLRLTKLYLTKNDHSRRIGLRGEWEINSTAEYMGRPYRIVTLTYEHRDPTWHPDYVHSRREEVHVPRDLFDQIVDTVREVARTYWTNIFVHETCNHPHHKVDIDWEGDKEFGYYKQLRCNACRGGYVREAEIDRYLPPEQRRPDQINGNPIHPMDRKTGLGASSFGRLILEDHIQ